MATKVLSESTIRTYALEHSCPETGRKYVHHFGGATLVISMGSGDSIPWHKFCPHCAERLPQTPEECEQP